MATTAHLPLTRDQRVDADRHPRHASGGLIIHATGMVGFAHAYFTRADGRPASPIFAT
jgi:hypothetical protein